MPCRVTFEKLAAERRKKYFVSFKKKISRKDAKTQCNKTMCGRFSLRARNAALLAEYFDIVDLPPLRPRYNIAPSQPVAVVRHKPGDCPNPPLADGTVPLNATKSLRELVFMRWGLIPSWAKDVKIGFRMINARAESLAEKPAFRAALQRRRCLIPADGFYEWKVIGRSKQPYFIHFPDDRPFAFAGLWESWEGPDNAAIESCTIITTTAGELIRPIHDRMPVILPPELFASWLDPAVQSPEKIAPLLVSDFYEGMEIHPVSTLVNKPTNDVPECVDPI
jgi:putative SOS response-associated peptidase YedK